MLAVPANLMRQLQLQTTRKRWHHGQTIRKAIMASELGKCPLPRIRTHCDEFG